MTWRTCWEVKYPSEIAQKQRKPLHHYNLKHTLCLLYDIMPPIPVCYPPLCFTDITTPTPRSSSRHFSHVYFIHPDFHIRDDIHYWITPLSTTVQLSPHVSFNIWWICFKEKRGGHTHMHASTHTPKWHLTWLSIAEQLLWYLGQMDDGRAHPIWHFTQKKKHHCVSLCAFLSVQLM